MGGQFVEVQVRTNIELSTDVSPKLSETICGDTWRTAEGGYVQTVCYNDDDLCSYKKIGHIYVQVGHSYMGITFESTFKTDNVAELRTYREIHWKSKQRESEFFQSHQEFDICKFHLHLE